MKSSKILTKALNYLWDGTDQFEPDDKELYICFCLELAIPEDKMTDEIINKIGDIQDHIVSLMKLPEENGYGSPYSLDSWLSKSIPEARKLNYSHNPKDNRLYRQKAQATRKAWMLDLIKYYKSIND